AIDRSVCVSTWVGSVAELLAVFASGVSDVTSTVLMIDEPSAALALTLTTIVNDANSPAALVPLVKTTFPVPPTAGVVADQPAGAVAETNVVPVGTASVIVTFWASLAPALAWLS